MLAFRDRLRTHDDDRELYERIKRELAARTWKDSQNYADAKSEVVQENTRSCTRITNAIKRPIARRCRPTPLKGQWPFNPALNLTGACPRVTP